MRARLAPSGLRPVPQRCSTWWRSRYKRIMLPRHLPGHGPRPSLPQPPATPTHAPRPSPPVPLRSLQRGLSGSEFRLHCLPRTAVQCHFHCTSCHPLHSQHTVTSRGCASKLLRFCCAEQRGARCRVSAAFRAASENAMAVSSPAHHAGRPHQRASCLPQRPIDPPVPSARRPAQPPAPGKVCAACARRGARCRARAWEVPAAASTLHVSHSMGHALFLSPPVRVWMPCLLAQWR